MQLSYIHYQVLFFIFFSYFLYLILNKQYKKSFYFFLFSFPFKNIYFYVGGLYFELWKTYSLVYLILLPGYFFKQYQKRRINITVLLISIYILYTIIITVLYGYWLSEETLKGAGVFKEYLRPIVQIVFVLIFINLIFIPSFFLKNHEEIIRAFRYYLNAMIFLSILGLLQAIGLYLIGYDIFPIPRLDNKLQELVEINNLEGTLFMMKYRITSLCTEPKNFAVFLSFAIILLLEFKKFKVYKYKYHIYILFLLLTNLLFTFSTTGYIAIILYIFVKIFTTASKYYVPFFILMIIFYLTVNEFRLLIDARIFDKLHLEGVDQGIFNFFIDNPLYSVFGVGYGNIHRFAATYLEWSTYRAFGDTAFTAISGSLYLIGAVGIIGLIFLYGIFLNLFLTIRKYPDTLAQVIANVFFVYVIFNLMRNEPLVYLMAGMSFTYINIQKKNLKRINYK